MNSTDRLSAPDGLPVIQAGAHGTPEDGACLMEYVSVLAGSDFNDHPRCTDPTLAAVARYVNDSCTETGRQTLVSFAPTLAATGPAGARGTAAIVLATVRAANQAAGEPRLLRRQLRRAEQRYTRVTGAGPLAALARHLDGMHRLGPAMRRVDLSVAALRALPEQQRDRALHATLAAAIAAAAPLSTTGSSRRIRATEADGEVMPRAATAFGDLHGVPR
jgi:hypothetical protein